MMDRFHTLHIHQARTQPKHENAKLHLVKSPISIQITFHKHAQQLIIPHLQTKQVSAHLQALKCYEPHVHIHEQPEPVAKLPDEPFRAQPRNHRREAVLKVKTII